MGARSKSSALPQISIPRRNRDLNMDVDTEIYVEEQAEIIARKAVEGYRQATQYDSAEGGWIGRTFEAYDLVAAVGEIDDYPTEMLREEIASAACDFLDEWGGPWVRQVTEDQP
jgi:hypothetical protein